MGPYIFLVVDVSLYVRLLYSGSSRLGFLLSRAEHELPPVARVTLSPRQHHPGLLHVGRIFGVRIWSIAGVPPRIFVSLELERRGISVRWAAPTYDVKLGGVRERNVLAKACTGSSRDVRIDC